MSTQAQLDTIRADGKKAYFRDVGTHGPTFREPPIVRVRTLNPHLCHTKEHLAWQRGYDQDTRRVIAER
jgi:hypothetical protein